MNIINTLPYDIPVVISTGGLTFKTMPSKETLNKLMDSCKPPRFYLSTIIPKATKEVTSFNAGTIYIVEKDKVEEIKQKINSSSFIGLELWVPTDPITTSRGFLGWHGFECQFL